MVGLLDSGSGSGMTVRGGFACEAKAGVKLSRTPSGSGDYFANKDLTLSKIVSAIVIPV